MSADNWATCPRCEAKRLAAAEKAVESAQAKCDEAYGKVNKDCDLKVEFRHTEAVA